MLKYKKIDSPDYKPPSKRSPPFTKELKKY